MTAAGGSMPLVEHLRELRRRLTVAILFILVGTVAAWIFYEPLLELLAGPYDKIRPDLEAKGIETSLVLNGVGGAFTFQLKISLVAGLILSSPLWLWQMWAFILPALHRHEKKWTLLLTATGLPLFLGGAALGYVVLPKAILLLIGFVPEGWQSLLSGADYLSFIIRMMLVFGIAAEIPLVVVLLNHMGAVSAKRLAAARPWTIIGIFVFAGIATPTTDPLTMLILAAPMTVLYLVAEAITHVSDRRKARKVTV